MLYTYLALTSEYLHHPNQSFLCPSKTGGHQTLIPLLLPFSTPDLCSYPGSFLMILYFMNEIKERVHILSGPTPKHHQSQAYHTDLQYDQLR